VLKIIRAIEASQISIVAAELIMPEPWSPADAIAIEKLQRYKPPGASHIPPQLIQAECDTLHYEVHKLYNSIWNKE
jgi:hypothetical protein